MVHCSKAYGKNNDFVLGNVGIITVFTFNKNKNSNREIKISKKNIIHFLKNNVFE